MIDTVTIKEVKVKLGELCKQKRQSYEITQEDLAEALELSRFTIQNFENGKNATLDTVLKITNHFGLLESFYQALKDLETNNDIKSLY
jgi:DNA-binding XRE family transcriptional regulator